MLHGYDAERIGLLSERRLAWGDGRSLSSLAALVARCSRTQRLRQNRAWALLTKASPDFTRRSLQMSSARCVRARRRTCAFQARRWGEVSSNAARLGSVRAREW